MNDRQAPAGYPPAGSTDDTARTPYGYGYPQETGYTHPGSDGITENGGGYGSDPYGQATAYDNGRHTATGWDNTPAHGMPRFQEFADHSDAGHGTPADGWGARGGYDSTGPDGWGGESTAPTAGHADGYGTGWDGYTGGGYTGSDTTPSHGSHGSHASHGSGDGWGNGWDGTADTAGSTAVQPTPDEWDSRGTGTEGTGGWDTGGGWDAGNGTHRHDTDGYGPTGHEAGHNAGHDAGYDSGYDDPYGVAGGDHRETDGTAGTDAGYGDHPEHGGYPERIPGDEPDDSPGPDTMAFRAITHRLAAEGTDPDSVDADHRSGFGNDTPEGPDAGPRRGRRRSPK
ncbi:hypothetical protein FNQ90_10990, partial [Streptomyces alkaliphilus]|nr:hypothetical protein [Streptomyces alkaliphilus]